MRTSKYTFQDVVFFSSKHKMTVKDEWGQEVGSVIRTHHNDSGLKEGIRKCSFYAFEDTGGELQTSVAVKKNGLKSLKGYKYELYDYKKQQACELSDVKWAIYIYFHVKGMVNSVRFEAYQDWDANKLILKANKKKYATISFNELTFRVTIDMLEGSDSFLHDPAFLTQVYCIFRLYDLESKVIEELMF